MRFSEVSTFSPALFRDRLLSLAPTLPEGAIARLYDASRPHSYTSGEFLLREGDACKGIFLVWRGTVQLCLRQGRRGYLDIRKIASPAILGLSETLLDNHLVTSVRALTAVEAALVPRRPFLEVLREFPVASIAFSALLSDELNSAYQHLSVLRSARQTHGLAVGSCS